ncbi:MAG: hypothetical protein ACE5MH_10425, partial [Terriglobia bacterium]
MRLFNFGLILVSAGMAWPQQAFGQAHWQCGPSPFDSRLTAEDSALAARYAPIYWFGPGERYYPTVPFFTAFDGIDNNGNGAVDLADPLETAPPWNVLNQLYLDDDTGNTQKIKRSAIFFRVCDLAADDIQAMWRYLKSDEQAWHRFDIDPDILSELLQTDAVDQEGLIVASGSQFRVIQYYAFYLRDYGLQGHPYDSEPAYVFVPTDEKLAEEFRIVVGGGHTERVPNNVVVMSGASASRQRGLDSRPSILVELGDHSSSPDLPPYGAFSPGLDANWHNYDLWGTRDVQASSGLGAIGTYRPWMTFPRDPALSVRLFPPVVPDSSLRKMNQIGIEDAQRIERYSLLPVEPFAELFDQLAETQSPPTTDEMRKIELLMARIVELMHRKWRFDASAGYADRFSGFDKLNESEKIAAVVQMQEWLQPDNTVENHYIWMTNHYTSAATRIFKQHLFRPVFKAMDFPVDYLRQFNFALAWQPGRLLLQLGWDVPAFWLPVRLDGYLSFNAGVYGRCSQLFTSCFAATSPAFAAVHTAHYSRLFSWYIRFSWIPRKSEVDEALNESDWLIGAGLALAPSRVMRLRFGLDTELRHTSPLLGESRFAFQLVVQPFQRG